MGLFVKFMVSPTGRISRMAAGVVLIAGGLLWLGGVAGIIVAAVGLVPLLAGLIDVCVFAPLLGYPFGGPAARARA
jgi:hypothetical protein